MHELMVEKVHAHGALAGCELVHSGHHTANLEIRNRPWGSGRYRLLESIRFRRAR